MKDQKWALLSFRGRMRRRDYWLYSIPVMLLVVPTMFYQGGNTGLDIISILISLFAIYASLALNMKRLQDRNRDLWWIVFTLVPVIGPIYALIDLGIFEGTHGANRYGPDPKVRLTKSENNTGTFEG